jgi:uncharacterized membrane protein YfcA
MLRAVACPFFIRAFGFAVPIGALAGLIGLGGGEFRLPVLVRAIGYPMRVAIPLNLVISFATLAFALLWRGQTITLAPVLDFVPEVVGLTLGGVVSAVWGTRLVKRLSDPRLTALVAVLLALLGALLVAEAFFAFENALIEDASMVVRALAGVAIGLGVGVVSSMLGVAGGELLIPALFFVFGAEIQTAGSASLMISLVIVATGIWRYAKDGAIPTWRGARRIVAAMAVGSLIGAGLGSLVVAFVSATFLKVFLGVVLIAAAANTFRHRAD